MTDFAAHLVWGIMMETPAILSLLLLLDESRKSLFELLMADG